MSSSGALRVLIGLVLLTPRIGSARSKAVIVLDSSALFGGLGSQEILERVRDQVSERWEILSFSELPGLLVRDPACDRTPRRERAHRLLREVGRAFSAFFQDIDPEEARERLGGVLGGVRTLPCTIAEEPLHEALAEAGLLQVRLLLMEGRPEAATEVARDLLRWHRFERLPFDHVPPEVRAFLERTVQDRKGSLVTMELPEIPTGWQILVGGTRVSEGPVAAVVAGRHRVDLLGPEEAFTTLLDTERPFSGTFRLGLSRAFQPGPVGTLRAMAEPEWDRRLVEAYGVDVLRVRRSPVDGACRVEVTASARDLPRQEVLWIDPHGVHDGRIEMVRKGVLVQRVPWYWAPLSGAISLGLIATGVALNVEANRTMTDLVAGEDRLGTWRSQRRWSIASYTLGAVLGVTAAALTWASHGMPARTSVNLRERPRPGEAANPREGTIRVSR